MILIILKILIFIAEINEKFKKAFDFLKTSDLVNMPCGKYEIDGENIFAIIQEYETKPIEDGKWKHTKYHDIQYIISGQEEMVMPISQKPKSLISMMKKRMLCF